MREKLSSRLGFLMLAAGCAVGLGNVWRFPFVVGENGGAAFVIIYILFLMIFGFPLLIAELSMGRASEQGIAGALKTLSGANATPKRRKIWKTVGTIIFSGNFLLMLYYTDVGGWLLNYTASYLIDGCAPAFGDMLADKPSCIAFMVGGVVAASIVCAAGVRNGVERITKWMMISLLVLLTVLTAKSLSLDGAERGLEFYLKPDWSKIANNPLKTVFEAMGQAFFTLSVGVGCMTIFGSYIGKRHSLVKESAIIIAIDTFVAFMSGLIIFPACATFDIAVNSGPGLIFEVLPKVFAAMPGGKIWATLFFLFLSLAALTTIVAVFECIIGGILDQTKRKRAQISLTVGIVVAIGTLPTIMFSKTLEIEDFIFSQLWLPLGAMVTSIFVSRRFGWGFENFRAEASSGNGAELPRMFEPVMKWIIPTLIAIVMICGIIG